MLALIHKISKTDGLEMSTMSGKNILTQESLNVEFQAFDVMSAGQTIENNFETVLKIFMKLTTAR